MKRNQPYVLLSTVLIVASSFGLLGCGEIKSLPQNKGVVAIVYADLTGSINEEIANREKKNIGELFRKLPADTKFYLFSIDKGTSKPDIYNFLPEFTTVHTAADEDKLKEEIEDNRKAKETTEFAKLNSSLNSYHDSIARQKGPVSCISNKLNSLLDMIENKKRSYPDYEIRVYFYSDMIEDCQNSFDGKPLVFKRSATDIDEEKHLQDIQNRIEKNFSQGGAQKEPKFVETKIYIILTSQDDKQSLGNLKKIWNRLFEKLGVAPKDIVWGNGNESSFWKVEKYNTRNDVGNH